MLLRQLEQQFQVSTLQRLNDPCLQYYGVELWLKRDDLIHPVISGNKWRKLKYSLRHALSVNTRRLISMGGAYSNFLHALAFAGQTLQLQTFAFIRGKKPAYYSATLNDLTTWGMQLEFVSFSAYRELRNYRHPDSLPQLCIGDYWLPEGGSSILALRGVAEIVSEINLDYDFLCVPCGTGATLAGLIKAVPDNVSVLGIAALKGGDFLFQEIRSLLPELNKHNWNIELNYHFGGFAKSNKILNEFINEFESNHRIELEPVYTGKMMYAIYDLVKQGFFQRGQRIIAIHTGGLQGKRQ